MAITFTCPRCQQSLTRADTDANTKIRCPSCDQKLLVPIPPALSNKTMLGVLPSDKTMLGTLPPQTTNTVGLVQQVQPHQPDFQFRVLCPHCQQALVVSSKYAGQHMLCPGCGGTFTVPSPALRPEAAAENVTASAQPQTVCPPSLTHKEQFLAFLSEHPDSAPVCEFIARAARAAQIPHFSLGYPLGDVVAYHGFLAFLTDVVDEPGIGVGLKAVVEHVQRNFGKKQGLASLLRTFVNGPSRRLQNDQAVNAALASPNSFFVPLSEITEVEYHRGIPLYRTAKIRVAYGNQSVVLCQDENAEPGGTLALFAGNWHLELVELLRSAAKHNQGRR